MWDVAFVRWLFERYNLFGVEPVGLLVRDDPEVRVAASADAVVLYMPHAYDVALNVDLSGYRCELWDLENRRPVVPVVEAGMPTTVRASVYNGDVLVAATR